MHQDGPDRFRFVLDGRDGKRDLVVDLTRGLAWLAPKGPAPGEPTALANQLRNLVKRARLVRAFAVDGERALAVVLLRGGERTTLWLELFGAHANLYVVDADGVVRATPRGAAAARRDASVGAVFAPTPARDEPPAAVDAVPEGGASAAIQGLARARPKRAGTATRLRRLLKRAHKSASRHVDALEGQATRAADADAWRHKGELLRGSFHLLKPGLALVRVPDYEQDPPAEIEIELDPHSPPGEQVARCFARAKKAERALAHARATLPGVSAERDQLAAALVTLEADDSDDACRALIDTLPGAVQRDAARLLEPDAPSKTKPATRIPWREFTSKDGWTIRVGKSARDNDKLTLHASKPHDLFVHVRAAEGSHVIVPTPRGKTVPKETLLDAAELACQFSKRADAERNEVDYVERRHVRKARGAPAGQVLLERSKTLSVHRDDARRARLLGRPRG